MRFNKNKGQLLILFLAVGFFAGIIYGNFVAREGTLLSDVFLRSNLEHYLHTDVISEKYLWYVAKARILLLVIAYVLGTFPWKKIYVMLSLGVCGFFSGMMTVTAIIQLGIKGILLCIVGVLPQGIFYGMMYIMLLANWFQYSGSRWNKTKIVFVIIMFVAGIILETYVNPAFVKFVIRIL